MSYREQGFAKSISLQGMNINCHACYVFEIIINLSEKENTPGDWIKQKTFHINCITSFHSHLAMIIQRDSSGLRYVSPYHSASTPIKSCTFNYCHITQVGPENEPDYSLE